MTQFVTTAGGMESLEKKGDWQGLRTALFAPLTSLFFVAYNIRYTRQKTKRGVTMTAELTLKSTISDDLRGLVPSTNRQTFFRWIKYLMFCDGNGLMPLNVDSITRYEQRLIADGNKPSTILAYLSAAKRGVRKAANSVNLIMRQTGLSVVEANALSDTLLKGLDSLEVATRVEHSQDDVTTHKRLTRQQATILIQKPDTATLKGLRDRALIAVGLALGLREAEVAALNVDDLRFYDASGALCLRVKHGKGNKRRAVYYGDYAAAVLGYVDAWLDAAGISSGPVFRGFTPRGQHVRNERLSERSIIDMMAVYELEAVGGVAYHDLRRTCARRWYEDGMPLLAISQQLGHSNTAITERYIGALDNTVREPKGSFTEE